MADTIVRKVIMQLTADDADAEAKLEAIKAKADELRTMNPELTPKINTAEASAKMAVFRDELKNAAKDVTAKIDVDNTKANAEIDNTDRKLDELNAKKVDPGGGGMMGMMMWPAIIAGVAAALPVLPAALAAVGAAAGTLVLAFGPVIKALTDAQAASQATAQSSAQLAATEQANATAIASAQKAISDATTQAAHDQVTSAQAVANAQQSLADAERTAAQDAVTSAQQVAGAERSLASAQQSEQMAQQNLTLARQQAVLTLQQLQNSVADTALGEQQAQLNLQQVEANQAQVNNTATSTALQRAQAALSVQEAQQALTEAQQASVNATNANNTAQQEGVNGLPAVVSAQQAYQQSVQGVADAQQSLQNAVTAQADQAQKDAESVANAQQAVSDAVRQSSWTQQKDAEAVQSAVDALSNTYKQQQLAAQAAAASSPAAQLSKDMAGLAGPAQQVVGILSQMWKELKPLEEAAQGAVMPGVVVFLQGVQSLLPLILPEIKTMGGLLGDAFGQWGSILQSSGFQGELKTIFDDGNQFLSVVLPAITGFVNAFIQMGANSGGAVSGFAQGLSSIMGGFGQLFQALSDPQNQAALGQFWAAIGSIIGSLGAPLGQLIGLLAQGLGPFLAAFAPVIAQVAGAVAQLIQALPPPVIQAITGAIIGWAAAQWLLNIAMDANPIGLIVLGIVALIIAIAEVVKYWPEISKVAAQVWGDVVHWTKVAADFITHTFDDVRHFLAHVGDDIASFFITGFDGIVSFFEQLPGWLLKQGELAITGLFNGFMSSWAAGVHFIDDVFNYIVNGFMSLYNWMLQAGENIVTGIWNGLVKGFGWFASAAVSLGKMMANALLSPFGIHISSPPSEAAYMIMAGQRINEGIAKGLAQSQSAVTAGMARTNQAISAGTTGAAPQKLQLEFVGNANDPFWQLIKRNIRVRGGNVQIVGA